MKKTKKTKAIALALAMGSMMNFVGCNPESSSSDIQTVYGPPVIDEQPANESTATATLETSNDVVDTSQSV